METTPKTEEVDHACSPALMIPAMELEGGMRGSKLNGSLPVFSIFSVLTHDFFKIIRGISYDEKHLFFW
ncbi:MAG: hypothetical protein LBD22_05315 [Spirochaetaceae bacterium]|jgi:hypothetical protein|nr:hypothetical protein [Spirochaetaceae bacterium]